jgi:inhibitor of cysteine peptidase
VIEANKPTRFLRRRDKGGNSMVEINKTQSGADVEVILGEPFEVRLPENPTTGFRWKIHASGAPTVEVEADSFQPPDGAVGAGGTHRWRFRTAQAGVATLEMDYGRSWEQRPAETFRVTIHVKPR